MDTKEHIEQLKLEQSSFLAKCENLAQQFITILSRPDSDKLLEKYFFIFESVVLTLQEELNKKWSDMDEETSF